MDIPGENPPFTDQHCMQLGKDAIKHVSGVLCESSLYDYVSTLSRFTSNQQSTGDSEAAHASDPQGSKNPKGTDNLA